MERRETATSKAGTAASGLALAVMLLSMCHPASATTSRVTQPSVWSFSTADGTLEVVYEIDRQRTSRECEGGFPFSARIRAASGLACEGAARIGERSRPWESRKGRLPGSSVTRSIGSHDNESRGIFASVVAAGPFANEATCRATIEGVVSLVAFVDPTTGYPLSQAEGGVAVERFPAGSVLEALEAGIRLELPTSMGDTALAELSLGDRSVVLTSADIGACSESGCAAHDSLGPVAAASEGSVPFRASALIAHRSGASVSAELGCAFRLTVATLDEDADGLPLGADCDDTNPSCGNDCTDADADGLCRDADCDDLNDRCGADCTDGDGDGFCVGSDCHDGDAGLYPGAAPACDPAVSLHSAGAQSGFISLRWDPSPGASGYRVYWGLQSGQYTYTLDVGNTTSASLFGLDECTEYYLAVSAYDAAGEFLIPARRAESSQAPSLEVSGWTTPFLTSVEPAVIQQGQQDTGVVLRGGSFAAGTVVQLFGPPFLGLQFLALDVIDCNTIELRLEVGPTPHLPYPAQIGAYDVGIVAPTSSGDALFFEAPSAFSVAFLPSRADIDGNRRVDGFDLYELFRAFGSSAFEPDYDPRADMDGDGIVDGRDLGLLAVYFGRAF